MLFTRRLEKIGIPPQSKVYKVAEEMSKYFSVSQWFLDSLQKVKALYCSTFPLYFPR